jgi:hypothetical protein
MTRYFKSLAENGEAYYGGRGRWSLPTQNEDGTWTPGEWWEIEGELILCQNALHATTVEFLPQWLCSHIYDIEFDGEVEVSIDGWKVGGRRARLTKEYTNWNERRIRLLVCRIAEDVLHVFEAENKTDLRPRKAIEVARLYAEGKAAVWEMELAEADALDASRAARTERARYAAICAMVCAKNGDAWSLLRTVMRDAFCAAITVEYRTRRAKQHTMWLLQLLDEEEVQP